MEELQSTEILDREIMEDARKKAHRILKSADDSIQAKAAEWEKKLSADIGELTQKYTRSGSMAADEIMAALPIEKRRIKAGKIEALLNAAVENWYAGIDRRRVLELLREELAKRAAAIDGSGSLRAAIHKIDRAEAESVLRAVLPGRDCSIEEVHSSAAYPEIILENREVRIYASINKTVETILGEKRAELVEALIGREAALDFVHDSAAVAAAYAGEVSP